MPENLFFVPHTRWDREWYKSFEVFRLNFVNMMSDFLKYLKKGGTFPAFVLDGQCILLRDFLQVYPEKKELLAGIIRRGIIRIGPWMVQPDLFLSQGEVTVRNLLEGKIEASKWEDYMNSLYIPESSGIISQLPQIMKNFDMEHLVFIRGLGDEVVSTEYRLKGADGAEVIATYLINAYNNAGFLPDSIKEAKERIKEEIDKLSDNVVGNWYLMNQGGDHQAPQRFLCKVIQSLKDSAKFLEIESGGYDDYFKKIKDEDLSRLPKLEGEYRGSRHYPILSGKTSAHMDLKLIQNSLVLRMLNFMEPMAVIQYAMGRHYPKLTFKRIWHLLLQNEHHTTAGGTVIDQVYREGLIRLDKVKDLMDDQWKRTVDFLSSTGGEESKEKGTPLVIVNTLPVKRSGLVKISYTSTNPNEGKIKVVNDKGEEVPCQVLNSSLLEGMYPYYSRSLLRNWDLAIKAEDVPGLGYGIYFIKTEIGDEKIQTIASKNTIKNQYFEVGFEMDGTFFIKDLQTKKDFRNLNRFIDEADAGDLYNFSPIPGDMTLTQIMQDVKMEIHSTGSLIQSLHLKGNFSIPASLSLNRKERSDERVLCPFDLTITLYEDLPYIDCSLIVENKSCNHRLRVSFPTGSMANSVLVGQPFDFVERLINPPSSEGWIETPSPAQPFQGFLDLGGEENSMSIFSMGPLEYEIVPSSLGNEIRLTLVRSVDWLSREGLITRMVETGPKVPTPQGQSIGKMQYKYAIIPHKNSEDLPILASLYQEYCNPLKSIILSRVPKSLSKEGLISIEPRGLVVTAVKKAVSSGNIIVRFYNPTFDKITTTVRACDIFQGCRKTNMQEKTDEPFEDIPIEIQVGSKEIVTLEFCFKGV